MPTLKKISRNLEGKNLKSLNFQFTNTKIQDTIEKAIPTPKVLYFSVFLALTSLFVVWISQKVLPPEIPLLYGLPEGEDQITNSAGLMIPNLIAIASIVVNATLAFFLEDKFVKTVLIYAGLAIVIFSTITTVKIIFLVGSI